MRAGVVRDDASAHWTSAAAILDTVQLTSYVIARHPWRLWQTSHQRTIA